MTRRTLVTLTVAAFLSLPGLAVTLAERGPGQTNANPGRPAPVFQVDPTWPNLPHNWVTGPVTSVAVGPNNHVWVLHRSRALEKEKRPLAAPPVLEFDENGTYVMGWGGDGIGYDWPAAEHGITVDFKGHVWITGSSPSGQSLVTTVDNMVLKFSNKGVFMLQIGGKGLPGGNNDTKNLERATDVAVYPKTNEAFVSDGYGNRRVIVFDADSGAFKRMWGAFGNPPDSNPPAGDRPTPSTEPDGWPVFANPVHGVSISNDGLVYVSDRTNMRVQVFTIEGTYVSQVFINRDLQQGSAARVSFSADPGQTYMYVADYGNSRVVVVNRKTLEVLYQFGKNGAAAGDFQSLHHLASDAKGNVYTAEVPPGNRAQRFLFKGISIPRP